MMMFRVLPSNVTSALADVTHETLTSKHKTAFFSTLRYMIYFTLPRA